MRSPGAHPGPGECFSLGGVGGKDSERREAPTRTQVCTSVTYKGDSLGPDGPHPAPRRAGSGLFVRGAADGEPAPRFESCPRWSTPTIKHHQTEERRRVRRIEMEILDVKRQAGSVAAVFRSAPDSDEVDTGCVGEASLCVSFHP